MTTPRKRRETPSAKPVQPQPDVGSQRAMQILEVRIERLEAVVEGLQDAIHRQAVLSDERLDELGKRTEPHQLARALSQDARKRGL